MADIELVIKIPEEKYIKCKWKNNGVVGLEWWERAIANGIPLEQEPKTDVFDKIRAEIEESRYGLINDGLDVALKIIDKYREAGKEK